MARKIVIASGKGGAGKSSLAAGLGGALAGMGKHILLIDCDIGLRSLDLILGCAENTVYDWADVLLGRCAPEKAPLSVGGLHLLAAPLRDTPAFTPGAMHSLTAQYDAFFDDCIIQNVCSDVKQKHEQIFGTSFRICLKSLVCYAII